MTLRRPKLLEKVREEGLYLLRFRIGRGTYELSLTRDDYESTLAPLAPKKVKAGK